MEDIEFFVRSVSDDVLDIARKTVEHFGNEKADQFILSATDGLKIKHALIGSYRQTELMNLVNAQAWGLLKEFRWLQFLFLAGNYPLVKSRLRFIWEAVYRAYFVETHEEEAVRRLDLDEKLKWIEAQKPRLDWKTCILPSLEKLLPLVRKEAEVSKYYKDLWEELNQYVHPSAYLQNRMVDESTLLIKDSFDAAWAEDTLRAGKVVTDLVWLAVLTCHEKAIASLSEADMIVGYPVTSLLLKRGCALN